MSEPVNQVITYDEMGNAKTIPRNNELIISNDNVSSNYTLKQQETVILNKDENETKSQVKENCLKRFKNKNKKCFIFICIVISLAILIIIAGFIYLILRDDDGGGGGSDGDKKGIYASDGEKLVAKIKREKHQCCIVNETISIKLKQVDNDNISTEKTEEPLYHKYLLNIYDEEKIKDKPIKYYAYVLLLKQLEGNLPDIIAGNNIFDSIETENARNLKKELYEQYLSENQDLINEDEDLQIKYGRTLKELELLNLSPLVKFSFFENGTVYEILKPKKIDDLLYANIENFIWKNIPSLSESLYTSKEENSKRNLEEKGIIREYSSDDKTETVNLKEIEKTSISFSDSKVDSEVNFQINKEGNLNEINSYATLESISDSNNQIKDIPITGPFSNNDIEDKDQNIIESPVLSVSNIITTQMNLESITINETVKDTIEKIIKDENIEFETVYLIDSNFNGKNERRKNNKLNLRKENNLFTGNLSDYPDISQLKNLADLNGFTVPIMFSYSLYKSNLVGVKVGMSALVKFDPKTLTSHVKLIFNTNDEPPLVILEKNETSTIQGSFDLMDKVINQVGSDLTNLSISLESKTNKWVKNIKNELTKISNFIKKFDDISKIFIEPLNNLTKKIKQYDNDQFGEIHQKINETDGKMKQLIQNVSSNPIIESNVILIKEETSSSFTTFVSELHQNINDLHELIKSFIESLIKSLTDLYGKPIDVSIYYSIIEELDLCSNIYTFLDEENLRKSIELEKENYSLYINDIFTQLEIDNILILNENIAKRLQTNETLKESIEEKDRNDMINKLNSFRTQITNIITKINSHIDDSYNIAINSLLLDSISNYKNEFEEIKQNLLIELENVANGANNFLFHVNDLESVNEINTNIFKKRNELFSKYMIKKLQSITNSYLTKSKLNSIDNEIIKYSEKIINEFSTNKVNNFSNLKDLVDEFNSKVMEIDSNDMNATLYSNIFNIFNDTNLINSMYSNYYTELNPEFQKLNNTFFKQIFEKNLKHYVIDPVELKYLLSQMLETQLQQKDIINTKMTSLIYTYIKLMITYSYQDFISIIKKNIDYISNNIPNDNFENEALENVNYFKNKYQNLINYENSQLENLIKLTNKSFNSDPTNLDPLKISSYTKKNEKTLSIFVKQICDNVNTSYYNEYIYFNDDDIIELDAHQKENYYNAVFRYGVNYLKSIFSESSTIVSKDSIQGLSSEYYVTEYNSIGNYNKDQIINSIISYLRDLTNEEMTLINPYLENNFNDIKNVIDKNINEDIINGKIRLINSKVFVIENSLLRTIDTLKRNLMDKIDSGFLQEEKDYDETLYFLDLESILNNYKKQYNYFNNILDININETLNFIKYNEEYQILINNYIENSQEELMTYFKNIISETTKIFSDFKLLNLTLNFSKISLDHLEKVNSNLLLNNLNINEIMLNSFKDFIYITLNDKLQEVKNSILTQFNTSYNIFETNINQKSVTQKEDAPFSLEYFSKKLNDTLLDNLNIYITEIKSTLNSNYFYNYIKTQINNNLNILDYGKSNSYDLDNTLISNAMSLKKLCEERFEKEKVLLNEKIYEIIGENYKDNINNFIHSYSSIYLNKIYEEIFTDRILYQLEYSQLQIIDNKNFILNTINKLSSVQQPIYNSLNEILTKIKEEYSNNLIKSTEDNFFINVDEFNNKSGEEITKIFINEATKLLNSDNFEKNFNKVIIENIPKSFSEGFYNEMLEFYKQTQNDNINNLKNKFLVEITNKGKEIENLVKNCETEIRSKLPEPGIYTDNDILKIEIKITNFIEEKNSLLNNKENNIYIKTSDNKKQALESLFLNKIKIPINEIISLYNNSDNNVKDKFNNDILSFGDFSENTIKDLDINSFIEKTQNAYSVIENTRNEIINYITDTVNNFSKNIETKLAYDLNKYFNQNNDRRRLSSLLNSKNKNRKLEEKENPKTDLIFIKNKFPEIQEKLKILSNEIQFSTEFIEFNSQKNMLISKIQKGIDHLKDPIISSLNILKDYLSEEQYNSFEENLNNQADKIIEELENLLKEENKELTKIYNSINNDYSTLYVEVIVTIKAIIDTLLLTYFDKIFKKIKDIKVNESVNGSPIIIKKYQANMFGRIVTFENSVSNYGYSHMINLFYKDYKMNINIEVSGYSDIDSYYSMTNHRYKLKGLIGDGKIGINAIEDLTNGKTNVEAYINNNAITYYHYERYYCDDCIHRRRRLRGLLRALCGHWHDRQKNFKIDSKFKSIIKNY